MKGGLHMKNKRYAAKYGHKQIVAKLVFQEFVR